MGAVADFPNHLEAYRNLSFDVHLPHREQVISSVSESKIGVFFTIQLWIPMVHKNFPQRDSLSILRSP